MILVDLNQVMISNLMQNLSQGAPLNEDLVRHMVFNSLRSYKQKFGEKYGDLIICCDDQNYWRKQKFPYYKASRKDDREKSKFDWNEIFTCLNQIRDDIKEVAPYKVIQVPHAEADDIIGAICLKEQDGYIGLGAKEPILILSGDKDFQQLQMLDDVHQYSPVQKKFITCKRPSAYLIEHLLKGDRGDGIPNILSSDDAIVAGTRQKPITKKVIESVQKDPTLLANYEHFERNKMLIDLTQTPKEIRNQIVDAHLNNDVKGTKRTLLDYFIANKMRLLIECIEEF
jgi:hypothetical protein